MDARIRSWLDQEDARLTEIIRRHGWSIQYVGGPSCALPDCPCPADDEPPFAYTIGLFGLGHAELLVLGIGPLDATAVLNELGERIRGGDSLLPGQLLELERSSFRIIPEPVPNPGEIVLGANAFYDRPAAFSVPALQLSYCDGRGRFPWDDGCEVAAQQPRPGTFTA